MINSRYYLVNIYMYAVFVRCGKVCLTRKRYDMASLSVNPGAIAYIVLRTRTSVLPRYYETTWSLCFLSDTLVAGQFYNSTK